MIWINVQAPDRRIAPRRSQDGDGKSGQSPSASPTVTACGFRQMLILDQDSLPPVMICILAWVLFGEGIVPNYILYCLEGIELVRCERFAADDDEIAIQKSRKRQGTLAAELWCGARRVKQFAEHAR